MYCILLVCRGVNDSFENLFFVLQITRGLQSGTDKSLEITKQLIVRRSRSLRPQQQIECCDCTFLTDVSGFVVSTFEA